MSEIFTNKLFFFYFKDTVKDCMHIFQQNKADSFPRNKEYLKQNGPLGSSAVEEIYQQIQNITDLFPCQLFAPRQIQNQHIFPGSYHVPIMFLKEHLAFVSLPGLAI